MTIMFTEKINLKDLEETISNSMPLLALVGAGDLAVEKLRAARDELTGRAASLDPKTVRDQAQASFGARVEALQSELLSAPERLQAIPELAQEWPARAQSLFADVLSQAFTAYGDLAGRGKNRVSQVRREMPAGFEVDVEVTPVSRPTTSTARKATTSTTRTTTGTSGTTGTTATKGTTGPATTATKGTSTTATKGTSTAKPTAKRTTAKRSTTKKSATSSSPAKKSTTKSASARSTGSAGSKS
jgi:hypothetical protein